MISDKFLFLGVLLSGIYLWDSGIPQLGHLFLLLGLTVYLISGGELKVTGANRYLILFAVYSAIINVFYYLISNDWRFIISTAQILFNVMIYMFVLLMLDNYYSAQSRIVIAIWGCLLVQLCVYSTGQGNYTYFPRYSGTFNDPNQMAYWLLCSFAILVLLGWKNKTTPLISMIALFIYLFLLALTMSRSAFLGGCILLATVFARYIFRLSRTYLYFSLIFMALFLPIVIYSLNQLENINFTDIELLKRVFETDVVDQADERGYTRIVNFPEYLLLGSGQGGHERFNQNKIPEFISLEMHTTWGGLLHYYGIIGFSIILTFLVKLFNGADKYLLFIIISTFVYGFSTYSFRTPIFWILLAVAAYCARCARGDAGLKPR